MFTLLSFVKILEFWLRVVKWSSVWGVSSVHKPCRIIVLWTVFTPARGARATSGCCVGRSVVEVVQVLRVGGRALGGVHGLVFVLRGVGVVVAGAQVHVIALGCCSG